MKQFYINRTLVVFLFTFMTILLLISSLCICYAIEDKIDESKLDGYYLDPEEFETPNNFINGYGIIQNSYGYSRSIKYGLIDKNYNVVLKPDTYFQIDFDPVNKNIIYGYTDPWTRLGDIYKITDNGLVKITKEMYYLNMNDITEHSFFYDSNIISVQNKDLDYGVIDINGNIVMDFTKNYFYKAFSPIIIKYEILNDNYDLKNPPILKNAQIINEKGNILTNFKYDRIDFYLNNNESESEIVYIQVTKDNKINLLNLDNYSEVFDWSAFQVFRKYNNNIIAKNSEGKWGVLNKEFQIIKDFIYDDVYIKYDDTYKGEILEGEINSIRKKLLPEDKVKTPKNLTATLPKFDITLNGVKIKNNDRLYPFIVYKNITYFPMTYYDSRFLNLETRWETGKGLRVLKNSELGEYITETTKIGHPTTIYPTIAEFDIYVNNKKINNQSETYPLLTYKDITYFPMTWRFGVDEFKWEYKFTSENGLVINSR